MSNVGASELTLIRIVPTPSIFTVPHSPAYEAGCRSLFSLRDDEPYISLWNAPPEDREKKRVLAAFAARRPSRSRLKWIELPSSLFEDCGMTVRLEPDHHFECVAEHHYRLDCPGEAALNGLINRLRERFSKPSHEVLGHGKGEVSTLVKEVHEACPDDGYDPAGLGKWANDLLTG